jgi:hypothetical protein
MLDQILEADLDVLDAAGDSDLARHVRDCARCRAVARQIIGDTRSLGAAVAQVRATIKVVPISSTLVRERIQRRKHSRIALTTGLAAALGVVVVREWPRREVPVDPPPQVASRAGQESATRRLALPAATVIAARPTPSHHVRLGERPRPDTRGAQRQGVDAGPQVLATVAERTIVTAFPVPGAVAPVRLDTPSDVALGSTVAVDPPAGTRANILRTSNPTITVVWLYQ